MSRRALAFVAVIIGLGALSILLSVQDHTEPDLKTFVIAFAVTTTASLFKVSLPRLETSLSLNYVCLIWGIVHLSLAETMVLGVASAIAQSLWRARQKAKPIQIAFNAAAMCLAIWGAHAAFSWEPFRRLIVSEGARTLAAAIVYYLLNTWIVSTIVAWTEGESPAKVWKSSYLWAFPHYLLGASLAVAGDWLGRILGGEALVLFLPVAYLVHRSFLLQNDRLIHAVEKAELERSHAQETSELHLRTIRALALAIEAKDKTTGEHLHRVQTYALGLGEEFGLSLDELEGLRAAAILHDIGKIAVPEDIISKPAKLSRGEFAKMKIHPVVGAAIVEKVRFPYAVAPLIRAHHEKWDGTGYPDGLKGEQIPLGARILTAVDYFDALASDRQYRKALPLDKAMEILRAESGRALDPRVVEALERHHEELELRAKSTLDQAPTGIDTDLTVERGGGPDAGYLLERAIQRDTLAPLISAEIAVIERVRTLLAQSGHIDDCLRRLLADIRSLVPIEAAALHVRHENELRCLYAEGESADLLGSLRIAFGVGVSGWTASTGRPLLNGNPQTEFGGKNVPREFRMRSSLSIPMNTVEGVLGALTIYSAAPDAFTTDHLRVLMALESGLSYRLWLHLSGLGELACRAAGSSIETSLDNFAGVLSAHQPQPATNSRQ
ncbi:MAG: HD domain-containing protein [Bryobacteraceae bacterium]